jgi:methylated-DNA-[protein]-cysteine S-methyltransferase
MAEVEMHYTEHESPIGSLLLIASEAGLAGVFMEQHRHGPARDQAWRRADREFADARRQLDQYFSGKRRQFDLPLAFEGTPFQLRVWNTLLRIGFGETWSYGKLAREIGQPNASRAVGTANGRNPLSIIVPCHRVIGADGSLTGYGGGEQRKRWLLEHESPSPTLPF